MAETNRVAVRYTAESTYGVLPTTGWKPLRYTSETIGAEPQTTISDEIRSDRMVADLINTSLNVGGDANFELSYTSFDDLIEAALLGTWTTNVLKVGTVKRSFSIEKQFQDITQYIRFTGMRVGAMSLNFQFGQVATGSFTFAGNGTTSSGTAATGTTSAATTTAVMSGGQVANVNVNGSASTLLFRTINLTVDNTLRPIQALGQTAPSNQAYGRATITGTIEAYFDNLSLYTPLISSTAISVSFDALDVAGNKYTVLIPKLKFSSGTPQTPGVDQDVVQSLGFTALFDSTTSTSLQITRTPIV